MNQTIHSRLLLSPQIPRLLSSSLWVSTSQRPESRELSLHAHVHGRPAPAPTRSTCIPIFRDGLFTPQPETFPPVFQSHLSTSPKGTAADTPLSPTLSTFSAGVFSSPPYDLTLELNGFKAQSQFSSCSRQLAEILPLGASSRKAQINHTSQVLNIHQGQCSLYFNDAAWVHAKLLSRVLLFATLRAAAHQAPLSTGFSRQEYWNG